jgi:hypothetical protein
MVKKHQKAAGVAITLIAVWFALQYKKAEFASEIIRWYIDVSPLFLVMTFGSYCLFKLGYDLLTFNNYPDEIEKLADVSLHNSISLV